MGVMNILIAGIAATAPLSALARSRVQLDSEWLHRPMHAFGSDASVSTGATTIGGRSLREATVGASAGVSTGGDTTVVSTSEEVSTGAPPTDPPVPPPAEPPVESPVVFASAEGSTTATETHSEDGSSSATAVATDGGEGGAGGAGGAGGVGSSGDFGDFGGFGGDGGDVGVGAYEVIEPVEGPMSDMMGPESDMGPDAASPETPFEDHYADDEYVEVLPGPRMEVDETVSGVGSSTATGSASGDETSVFVSTSRKLASLFRQLA